MRAGGGESRGRALVEVLEYSLVVHLAEHGGEDGKVAHPQLELLEIEASAAGVDCIEEAALEGLRARDLTFEFLGPELASLLVGGDHELCEVDDNLRVGEGQLCTEDAILVNASEFVLEERGGGFDYRHHEDIHI